MAKFVKKNASAEETIDSEADSFLPVAMNNIFASCDTNNSNQVLVSKIIEFIAPFMQQEQLVELLALKKSLDPQNVDPLIDKETFFLVMSSWASQIDRESTTVDRLFPIFSGQQKQDIQTDTSSPEKNYLESNVLDLSNVSLNNDNKFETTSALMEQLNELMFQNNRLIDEVYHLKGQLTNYEEQNQALHETVNKLRNMLQSKQRIIDHYQQDQIDNEEIKENLNAVQMQVKQLEKVLISTEKENLKLHRSLQNAVEEKSKLEDSLILKSQQELKGKEIIVNLEAELFTNERELSSCKEDNLLYKSKLDEHQQLLNDYININQSLKVEKEKLEDFVIKSSITTLACIEPIANIVKHPLPETPIKLIDSFNKFNSPKLLSKIANPISPILSVTKKSKKGKCINKDNVTNCLYAISSSTPEQEAKEKIKQMDVSPINNESGDNSIKNEGSLHFNYMDSSDDISFLKQVINYSPHLPLNKEMSLVDDKCNHLECEKIIADKTKEIEELLQKIKENELTINRLTEKYQNNNVQEVEEKTEISQNENENDLLKFAYNEMKEQNERYKQQLYSVLQETEQLSKDIQNIKLEFDYTKNHTTMLTSKIISQESLIEEYKKEILESREIVKVLENKLTIITTQYENLMKEKQNWPVQKPVFKVRQEDRGIKKGNFDKMQLQIERLKSNVEAINELLKDERSKNSKLVDEIDKKNKEISNVLATNLEIEENMKKTTDVLKKAQNDMQQLKEEKKSLSENLNVAQIKKKRSDLLLKENKYLKREKMKLESDLWKLQNDLKDKEEKLLKNIGMGNEQFYSKIEDFPNEKQNCLDFLNEKASKLEQKIDFLITNQNLCSSNTSGSSLEIESLRLDNKRELSMKTEEDTLAIKSIDYFSSSIKNVCSFKKEDNDEQFYLSESYPSLLGNFLENVELPLDGSDSILTTEDIEERYSMLVTAFAIDIKSINKRVSQQEVQQNNMQSKFSFEFKTLITTLKAMKKLKKQESFNDYLNRCIHQVEVLQLTFVDASVSSIQYGALCCEQRLLKCINLAIIRTSYLEKLVQSVTEKSQLIRSKFLCNRNNESLNKSIRSNDSSLMSADEDPQNFHQGIAIKQKFNFFNYFMYLCVILGISCILVESLINFVNRCKENRLWQWITWNDIFGSYLKKSYPYGSPPI